MHFSCKLTNTVFRFLEKNDEDLSALVNQISVSEELMRDPSCWIAPAQFESFLTVVVGTRWNFSSQNLLQKMAQSCAYTRSWGVLDSVLRMMRNPTEVFVQPDRFLSYFISPAPPVDRVVRTEYSIGFDLPLSPDQYPLAGEFLRYSFEMVPVFMGFSLAECRWNDIRLELDWRTKQDSIFVEEDLGRQLSPDLVRDVLNNLSSSVQGKTLIPDALPAVPPQPRIDHEEFFEIRNKVTRLSDYMVRAQQLITLLVATRKLTPDVKEAMKRVNWEHVQMEFPKTVEECYQIFRNNQEDQNHV